MTTSVFGAMCLLGLTLTSCKKSESKKIDAKDLTLSVAEQQKARTDNAFTFNLFKSLQKGAHDGKNIFISPLSANTALSMTANGSAGETLTQMREALQFTGMKEDEVNTYYQKLLSELPALDPKTTLKIANSIWYRQGFDVLPEFKKVNTDHFKASIQELDFKQPSSKDKINTWVKEETNGKIPTIIDDIPANAVMYLINAIYFKGQWKYQFDKSKTRKLPFYLNDNSTVQADFMSTEATLNVLSTDDASIIELPYGNDKFSMVILQPANDKSINDLINTIDEQKWQGWMSGLKQTTRDIQIPKFKFAYETTLNESLTDLGMGIAFTPMADFTRINAGGGLLISKVKQKAFVEVNEEGTEAAAATSVEIELTSVRAPIVVNKPFLFAIREKKNGLLLFIGQMNNPLLG